MSWKILVLVLVTAFLLAAGCTQPSGVATSTATPTLTTVTTLVTKNVTPNVTLNVTDLKAEMAVLAGTFAGEINKTALVTVATEGRNGTAFTTVLDQLRAFRARDSRIVYVYTLAQQNGTLRFIADANYGQQGATTFLQEYTDAPAESEAADHRTDRSRSVYRFVGDLHLGVRPCGDRDKRDDLYHRSRYEGVE